MPLTDEQEAIASAVGKAEKSLMVNAYAGTGKTSTIEAASQRVREPALALAFNKVNATELGQRLPQNFQSKTMNGLGHGAWLRVIDRVTPKLDGLKLHGIVRSLARENNMFLTNEQLDDVRTTVTAAMVAGISPGDRGAPLMADTEENWRSVMDCSPADAEMVLELAKETLETSINLAKTGHMTFDDQVYCPTILGGKFPRFPRVFVDEAQDLSPLNHKMLSLCTRDDGLMMAVGDPKQAIYQFRGADADSMDNMRVLRPEWEDLALTMTFRCPKAVVARQQEHAPGYRAYEANLEGLVTEPPYVVGNWETVQRWSWEWVQELLAGIPPQLMDRSHHSAAIICRNNAPLLSLAFKLIRGGVGCEVAGKDIGKGLVAFTKRISKDDNLPMPKFAIKMQEWVEKEVSLAEINKKPERAEKLRDQEACIVATMEGASPNTVGDLRYQLENLFKKENRQLILSTGHKAKGMEWPLVVHLDPFRIPSKFATMAAMMGDPKPLEQEYNLRYVTETRTKHTLVNADLETFV